MVMLRKVTSFLGNGAILRWTLESKLKHPLASLHTTSAVCRRGRTQLDANVPLLSKYTSLPLPNNLVIAEYVWIDGTGEALRSRTQTLGFTPKEVAELPRCNHEGFATAQANVPNSDVYIKPVRIYPDPLRGGKHILVLCECTHYDNTPHPTNTRHSCEEAMEKASQSEPMFGFEQEYSLVDGNEKPKLLGWPSGGFPEPMGPYYFGMGAGISFGRDVVEAHYRACLYANLPVGGINAEASPSQWEYQVGPTIGIKAADDLWMSRFLLNRIAEQFNVGVTFDPKPVEVGEWFGAGCHANFSTKEMRAPGGLQVIEAAMAKLEKNHAKHIKRYDPKGGQDNSRRLTGTMVTSTMDQFSWGVADRSCSVRMQRAVKEEKCGYFEDRRPASNADPYVVAELLVRTTVLDE